MPRYKNRQDAGRKLAQALYAYQSQPDVIVLALPRGGVPVAYEVAKSLAAPLDVFIVRKLGLPWHHELAMGAIAAGGTVIFNDEILQNFPIAKKDIDVVVKRETAELLRREKAYRGDRPFPVLKNKIVILVDDGIATGATMRAAIAAILTLAPAKLVVAVPVADQAICQELLNSVDDLICPLQPDDLQAVGLWYEDFSQTEDNEVRDLLQKANQY